MKMLCLLYLLLYIRTTVEERGKEKGGAGGRKKEGRRYCLVSPRAMKVGKWKMDGS